MGAVVSVAIIAAFFVVVGFVIFLFLIQHQLKRCADALERLEDERD